MSSDVDFAENYVQATVDFKKKAGDSENIKDFKQKVLAMLNTCGGIIDIPYSNDDARFIEVWKEGIRDQFNLPFSVYDTCVEWPATDGAYLRVLVKPAADLVMNDPDVLFQRRGPQTICVTDTKTICHILKQKPSERQTQQRVLDQCNHGEKFNIAEDTCHEFKYWESAKLIKIKSRLNEKRTKQAIFAMANMPTGGDVYLGIEDKSHLVYGLEISEDEESQLKEFLQIYFERDTSKKERIWAQPGNAVKENEHWFVKFIEVENCPQNTRRRVIQIHINHYPGGVFLKTPIVYCMDYNSTVCEMDFAEWKSRILKEPIKGKCGESAVGDTLDDAVFVEPAQEHKEEMTTQIDEDDIDDDDLIIQNKMIWTDFRNKWDEVIDRKEDSNINKDIDDLRDTILNMLSNVHSDDAHLDQHITEEVNTELGRDQWIAFCVKEGYAQSGSDKCYPPPRQHISDYMIISNDSKVLYLCIMKKSIANCGKEYVLQAGRILKQKLAHCRHGRHKASVLVKCMTYSQTDNQVLYKSKIVEDLQMDYSLTDLAGAVAEVLLLGSKISASLEDGVAAHLTAKQIEPLISNCRKRFNLIEGPPGSGKTLMSIHIAEKFDMERVGVICGTKSAAEFFRHKRIKVVEEINNQNTLDKIISEGFLNRKQCIIIDDAQFLTCTDDSCRKLFNKVKDTQDMFLYILVDSKYQCYQMDFNMHSPIEKAFLDYCTLHKIQHGRNDLTDVQRNTQKIVSFMISCFEKEERMKHLDIRATHNSEGDGVFIHVMTSLREQKSDNEIISFIKTELMDESQPDNCLSDTAILVKNPEDVSDYRDLIEDSYGDVFYTQTANYFPQHGLIIDTIDNFIGMECKTCVFILGEEDIGSSHDISCKTSINNPRYRTYLASRATHGVHFIFPQRINVHTAKRLGFQKIPATQKSDILNEIEVQVTDQLLQELAACSLLNRNHVDVIQNEHTSEKATKLFEFIREHNTPEEFSKRFEQVQLHQLSLAEELKNKAHVLPEIQMEYTDAELVEKCKGILKKISSAINSEQYIDFKFDGDFVHLGCLHVQDSPDQPIIVKFIYEFEPDVFQHEAGDFGEYKVFHGEKEINSQDLYRTFNGVLNSMLGGQELSDHFQFAGFCHPQFSGVRCNGNASMLLFSWKDRLVILDISLGVPVSNGNAANFIKSTLKDNQHLQILESALLFLVPESSTAHSLWKLSTSRLEDQIINSLDKDCPARKILESKADIFNEVKQDLNIPCLESVCSLYPCKQKRFLGKHILKAVKQYRSYCRDAHILSKRRDIMQFLTFTYVFIPSAYLDQFREVPRPIHIFNVEVFKHIVLQEVLQFPEMSDPRATSDTLITLRSKVAERLRQYQFRGVSNSILVQDTEIPSDVWVPYNPQIQNCNLFMDIDGHFKAVEKISREMDLIIQPLSSATSKTEEKVDTEWTFLCGGCKVVKAFTAADVRLIQYKHMTVIDTQFSERYKLKECNMAKFEEHYQPTHDILCEDCDYDWGFRTVYKDTRVIPLIKVRSFKMKSNTGTEKVCQNRREVPFELLPICDNDYQVFESVCHC